MKTILVHIEPDEGQGARLQAAFDLARAFGGHLACMQVTPYAAYALGEPAMGAFPVTALVEAINAQRRTERVAVEARLQAEGVSWNWLSRDGDVVERLSEAARLAEVVVMSSGPFASNAGAQVATTGDVAIRAPSLVCAVPAASRGIASRCGIGSRCDWINHADCSRRRGSWRWRSRWGRPGHRWCWRSGWRLSLSSHRRENATGRVGESGNSRHNDGGGVDSIRGQECGHSCPHFRGCRSCGWDSCCCCGIGSS